MKAEEIPKQMQKQWTKPELKTKGRPRPKEKKVELRERLCAWGSYVQGPCGTRGIRGRGRSSNHVGDDGGTQTGTRSEIQWRSGWEPNVGAQNPKCKHHTEDEGGTVELPWDILELRPEEW